MNIPRFNAETKVALVGLRFLLRDKIIFVLIVCGLYFSGNAIHHHSLHSQGINTVQSFDMAALNRDAENYADIAMKDKIDCIAKTPLEFCDRDTGYQGFIRRYESLLLEDFNYLYKTGTTSRQERNYSMLFSFCLLVITLWRGATLFNRRK